MPTPGSFNSYVLDEYSTMPKYTTPYSDLYFSNVLKSYPATRPATNTTPINYSDLYFKYRLDETPKKNEGSIVSNFLDEKIAGYSIPELLGFAQTGLNIFKSLDDLFGLTPTSRNRSALLEAMRDNIYNTINRNNELMQMKRDEIADFKRNRDRITKSYFS